MTLTHPTITTETRTELESFLTVRPLESLMGFEFDGFTSVLFRLFFPGEPVAASTIELALRALGELGYVAPVGATRQDVAAVMDAIEAEPDSEASRQLQMTGAALALSMGDGDSARIILDGIDGAQIGWYEQRKDLAPLAPREIPGGAKVFADPKIRTFLARFGMIAYHGTGEMPHPTNYGAPYRVRVNDDGSVTIPVDNPVTGEFIHEMHEAAVSGNTRGYNDVRTQVAPDGITIWPGQA